MPRPTLTLPCILLPLALAACGHHDDPAAAQAATAEIPSPELPTQSVDSMTNLAAGEIAQGG